MGKRQTLPVLPLRGTVMFPGLTAPIAAGRPGTLRAIEAALKGDRLVFAVAQRDNTEEPAPDILYYDGRDRPHRADPARPGRRAAAAPGRAARDVRCSTPSTDGLPRRPWSMPAEEMSPLDDQGRGLRGAAQGDRASAPPSSARSAASPRRSCTRCSTRSPSRARFSDLVAGYIELTVPEKQGLLETLSVEERLRRVLVHVQRQIGLLEAQEDIKSQVQEELGERQREMFLREQLKAIQKELGDDDQTKEIEELREKLNKLELPKEARAEVERELGRLERSGRESMEAQVIRTYLEWIAELPWNTRSDDQLDLNARRSTCSTRITTA